MMVFISRSLPKIDATLARRASAPKSIKFLLILLSGLLLCFPFAARADTGILVKSAELVLVDETYQLKADFETNFGATIEDALNKGVPLVFVVEFELERPRWYWLDETIASTKSQIKISYHALTKQYHLQTGEQQKTFSSLPELKAELEHIEAWPVVDRGGVKKRNSYEARLRMKLDLSQLPKPLQVSALTSKEWSMESDWHTWVLKP
ncbi:MAG: DUF4390 domain-containing protein [Sulfuricellaceae bacterium]|nr:DUF4390 domain-containing protein [Sulfuricellaceae bacterium]